MYTIKIKRINSNALLPEYSTKGDAGMDLFSTDKKIIQPGDTSLINTGICIQLPKNTEAQIRPRSGLALKHSITVLNTPGTIDEGYRGEIGVILINHGRTAFNIEVGMRIAQLVIKPVFKVNIVEVQELDQSMRGEFGFGSSGFKENKHKIKDS